MIASSSNGRTADSDSVNLGSNPGEAANSYSLVILYRKALFFLHFPRFELTVSD